MLYMSGFCPDPGQGAKNKTYPVPDQTYQISVPEPTYQIYMPDPILTENFERPNTPDNCDKHN